MSQCGISLILQLEESWEQRKKLQQLRLEEERERQKMDKEETLRQIRDREQRVGKQWRKQSGKPRNIIPCKSPQK